MVVVMMAALAVVSTGVAEPVTAAEAADRAERTQERANARRAKAERFK